MQRSSVDFPEPDAPMIVAAFHGKIYIPQDLVASETFGKVLDTQDRFSFIRVFRHFDTSLFPLSLPF